MTMKTSSASEAIFPEQNPESTLPFDRSVKIENIAPNELDLSSDERSETLERVKKYSPSVLGHFRRAYAGKSRKAAVTAKCLECTCIQRIEVKNCPVVQCPLWEFRPYKN